MGSKKLISFLGKGKYDTVTYFYRQREVTTNLCVEAAVRIIKPDKSILLVTESLLKTGQRSEIQDNSPWQDYVEQLEKALEGIVDIERGEIPEGKSKEEIWKIFEICSRYVEKDDKLFIDITHGFRSLPLIVFVSTAYLQRVKDAKIKAILHGAYEAKNDGRVPILDLSELLDLFEWMVGVEFLKKSGDADLVVQAIRRTQARGWKEQNTEEQKPTKLQNLADSLKDLSDRFKSVKPLEVMQQATKVQRLIEEIRYEVKNWAKPLFKLVLGRNINTNMPDGLYDKALTFLTLVHHIQSTNLSIDLSCTFSQNHTVSQISNLLMKEVHIITKFRRKVHVISQLYRLSTVKMPYNVDFYECTQLGQTKK